MLRAEEPAAFHNRFREPVLVVAEIIRHLRQLRRLLQPVAVVRAAVRARRPNRSTTQWGQTIRAQPRLRRQNPFRLRRPKWSLATTRQALASKSKRFTGSLGNCEHVASTIFDAEPSTANSTRKLRHTGHSPVCFLLRGSMCSYVCPPTAVQKNRRLAKNEGRKIVMPALVRRVHFSPLIFRRLKNYEFTPRH